MENQSEVAQEVMPGPDDTYIAYGRDWANVSNTPFREYKHWVHEGGIATPLIMHWPNQTTQKGSNSPGGASDRYYGDLHGSSRGHLSQRLQGSGHPAHGRSESLTRA